MSQSDLEFVSELRALSEKWHGYSAADLKRVRQSRTAVGAAFNQATQSSYAICAYELDTVLARHCEVFHKL